MIDIQDHLLCAKMAQEFTTFARNAREEAKNEKIGPLFQRAIAKLGDAYEEIALLLDHEVGRT